MRFISEIQKDLDALERPQPRWAAALGGPAAVEAERQRIREWEDANPEKVRRFADLLSEYRDAEAQLRVLEEARQLERRVLAGLEKSGAGERALSAAASPAQSEALDAARKWLNALPVDGEHTTWLVLLGGTGTGKTVAATWALREAVRQGRSAYFRTASRLARLSGFNEGAVELEMLIGCGLLVLDDVGAEAQTAWGSGLLQELLDARHQASARTVITSNLSADDFKTRIGERMTDRIREDGMVVRLGGKSMRRA